MRYHYRFYRWINGCGWATWLKGMLLFACLAAAPSGQAAERSFELTLQETALQVQQIEARKKSPKGRLVWLASEYGVLAQEKRIATELAQAGLESWLVDFYEPLFLAPTAQAVEQVPSQWVAELIGKAREDGLPLWIVAPNKAAQLAVRGLHEMQIASLSGVGLILINPNLYLQTPQPGQTAQYWPQTRQVNLPVGIVQGALSPLRWRLEDLSAALAEGGSEVFVALQPKVRDRYYFRADALPVERQQAQYLANRLRSLMAAQLVYFGQPRVQPKTISQHSEQVEVPQAPRSLALQPYTGPQNLPLQLEDMAANRVALEDYRGQVVLVNFWASWCPPCVHEMPSMARLKTALQGQPFDILAVNLAEEKRAIKNFLMQHPLNFPVLLDPTGTTVDRWRVFAYPSSYLLDKQGQIRYALFGATDWNQADHRLIIDALLRE
jgi:thiol-disulfide isomerase/thioredoxin